MKTTTIEYNGDFTWVKTGSEDGWKLPEENLYVIVQIGSSLHTAQLDNDSGTDGGPYFHIEGPLADFSYSIDEVAKWVYVPLDMIGDDEDDI